MLPMVVGMMSASIISGQVISRTGRIRPFPLIGSALICVALFLLSRITADTDLLLVMAVMFGLGYGLGNCMQPLLLILQSAVPPRDIGVATSSATFFRQIGGTLGVAIFLSVLFGSVGANIKSAILTESQTPAFQQAVQTAAQSPNPLDRQVADAFLHPTPGGGVLAQVQNDSSIIQQMPAVLAHPFKAGFAESMDTVFLLAGCVAILAFLVLLLMPKVELRATSASAAVRSEAGADRPGDRPGLTRASRRKETPKSRRVVTCRLGEHFAAVGGATMGGGPAAASRAVSTGRGRRQAGAPMDLNTLYHRTVECWADRVNAVTDDQWDAPTPCRDWTVRDLVNHVVGEDRWTEPLVEGRTIAEVGDSLDGDLLGDDPGTARPGRREGGHHGGRRGAAARAAPSTCRTARSRSASTSTSSPPTTSSTPGTSPSPPAATLRLDPDLVAEVAAWYAEREHLYRGAGMVAPARRVARRRAGATCWRPSGGTPSGGSTTPRWRAFSAAFGSGDVDAIMALIHRRLRLRGDRPGARRRPPRGRRRDPRRVGPAVRRHAGRRLHRGGVVRLRRPRAPALALRVARTRRRPGPRARRRRAPAARREGVREALLRQGLSAPGTAGSPVFGCRA